jgi:phospholipid-translocating ATPase
VPHNPMQLPETRSHNHPEVFEMHVRGPSDDQGMPYGHAFGRSASSASHATASDSYHSADDGRTGPFSHHEGRQSPHVPPSYRTARGSNDHSAVVGSHSASPSWEGPRAL